MWIDINAYVGHWPFRQMQHNTCITLLKHMDRFGVSKSVVSNLNGIFYKNTAMANRELYNELDSLKRGRDRLIPFGVVNPIYAGWEYDLEECVEKFGMKGLRLYPKYHDYEMDDPQLIRLVLMAKDYEIPVSFNYRMVDPRSRSWMDIDYVWLTDKPEWDLSNIMPIIKLVPDAKYIILNVANGLDLPEEDAKLFRQTNVLIDTSGRTINNIDKLINTYGEDHFAFGTHSPIFDYVSGMLRIEAMRKNEANEATKEQLRSGNVIKFLNL